MSNNKDFINFSKVCLAATAENLFALLNFAKNLHVRAQTKLCK